YILIAIALACLAVAAKSQRIDDYGTKPPPTKERQQAVVKFHVALELMKGGYTPEQTELLLNAIADPASISEPHISLFKADQEKQIFYAIGTNDISKFKTIYKLDTLADKRLLYISMSPEDRAKAWTHWLAYNIATRQFSREQIDVFFASA